MSVLMLQPASGRVLGRPKVRSLGICGDDRQCDASVKSFRREAGLRKRDLDVIWWRMTLEKKAGKYCRRRRAICNPRGSAKNQDGRRSAFR